MAVVSKNVDKIRELKWPKDQTKTKNKNPTNIFQQSFQFSLLQNFQKKNWKNNMKDV